ncbi:MAG: FAD-dependent thymidylate synthase [Rhodospirillaceae bacterium]|nr:FAD-dependent thymidylate synthase [Rhodospirillaceae bacterium]
MPLKADQQEMIAAQRQQSSTTLRPTAAALEQILYQALPVLDHGFVRVIDYMGNDSAIVQAARVSYGKGTKTVREDQGLIDYLMRHHHTTPFEMCEIKYHVKLPIFIARQWIRHRTANVNEYSARYSIMENEFYVPAESQLAAQSKNNRQGRGNLLEAERARQVLQLLKKESLKAFDDYTQLMNEDEEGKIIAAEETGLARELARMRLPLNFYTQWYWKIDLHNLLHFLRLRAHSHAQYEIRAYADVMLKTVEQWVPATYSAFCRYKMDSASFSSSAMQVIRRLIKGEKVTQETSQMSKREWEEMMEALGLQNSGKKA